MNIVSKKVYLNDENKLNYGEKFVDLFSCRLYCKSYKRIIIKMLRSGRGMERNYLMFFTIITSS